MLIHIAFVVTAPLLQVSSFLNSSPRHLYCLPHILPHTYLGNSEKLSPTPFPQLDVSLFLSVLLKMSVEKLLCKLFNVKCQQSGCTEIQEETNTSL